MPGKRKQQVTEIARRRPWVLIAVAVVVSLLAAWTMLAYSGALDAVFRQKAKKGKTVSIAGLNSNAPSKEFIFAGGRMIATEEPISSGCAVIAPPTGLVAAATSTTQVSLSWSPPSSGVVDHYEIQRRQTINDAWTTLPLAPTAPSASDAGLSSGVTYLYRVRAIGAAGCVPSDFSTVDLATTIIFTDDPLVAQGTIIKAVHVSELRQAVNAVRTAAARAPATWTDPSLLGVTVKAVHVQEMRNNLDPALTALGFSSSSYTDPNLVQGSTNVLKIHVDELRQRVK